MYKPRTQKRIQNLSRAINKIDKRLITSMKSFRHRIEDVEAGINTVKYMQDGVRMEIPYSELEKLGEDVQASLVRTMTVDRHELRQERVFEQLSSKGKISWQFKRSLEQDKQLLKTVNQIEDRLGGNKPDSIIREMESIDKNFKDWEDEAENYFNDPEIGTPDLLEFYHNLGFSELSSLTWNLYKVIKGI